MNKSTAALLLTIQCAAANAYVVSGRWPQPETTLYFQRISYRGETVSPSGIPWDDGVLEAMARWNDRTSAFTLHHRERPRWLLGTPGPSCLGPDGFSVIVFHRMACFLPFQEGTLATTHIWTDETTIPPTILDADIIVNENLNWDIFDGPPEGEVMNFVQTVTHELGHLMGLDHDGSGIPALLHPTALGGLLEFPQRDDLLGLQSLYGGEIERPEVCRIVELLPANGKVSDEFTPEDCRRVDIALSAQDSDDSAVHLYAFDLPEAAVPLFVMESDRVDPLLELRSGDGNQRLKVADDFGDAVDAVLFHPLPPGHYLLIANTATLFGQFGSYTIRSLFTPSTAPPSAVLDGRDLSISVPAIEVDGQTYWAELVPFRSNSWRLERYGLTAEPPRGAILLPDGSLFFSAAEAFGNRYDALFRICPPPECPSDTLYWRLDRYWKR